MFLLLKSPKMASYILGFPSSHNSGCLRWKVCGNLCRTHGVHLSTFQHRIRNVPLEIDILDIYLQYFNSVGPLTVKLYYYLCDLVCVLNQYIYIHIIQYVHCMCVCIYIYTLYTYTYTYVQVRTSLRCLPNAESFQLQMGLEPGAGQHHPGQDGAARSGLVLR